MIMQFKTSISWIFGGLLLFGVSLSGYTQQEKVTLSVDRLFELVMENNPTLQVERANVNVSEQAVQVAKNNYLPTAKASVSAFYLGNIDLYSPDFQTHIKQDLPNFGNNYGVEAQQLLWKGGQVRESVNLSVLQQEIATLQFASAEQQAKLAALGYYLDLYKLYNQSKVYTQNIELANKRLQNIKTMSDQGMVTPNDLIRAELQVSNLNLAKLVVDNNILILNKQLNVAIGLPSETIIVPDEKVLQTSIVLDELNGYKQKANDCNPSILLTHKSVDIYNSSLKLAKKNWYPSLALFAGNNLNRPVTSGTPVDMYFHAWNAGVAFSYDLGSLWKNTRVVNLRRLEVQRAEAQTKEVELLIGVAVDAAYIKHNEAVVQSNTLAINKELANENYRIMENKYNNQLVIILDLLDASNSKLDAELQYANTEVNVIFAYFKLLKETGQL